MDLFKKKLITFLLLTIGQSSIWYFLIIKYNAFESQPGYTFALMWAPGISALAVSLIFDRSLRSLPWKPGKLKNLALAYFIPLVTGLLIYSITWVSGIGGFTPINVIEVLVLSTLGVLISILSAAGEEIGWRGFFVPLLYEKYGLLKLSIISGLVWYVYHLPIILFSTYNNNNVVYSSLAFLASIMAFTFIANYLTLSSKSMWPAILIHASHNLFFQSVFDRMTVDTGVTKYVTTEFGIGTVIVYAFVAVFLFIRAKKEGLRIYENIDNLSQRKGGIL